MLLDVVVYRSESPWSTPKEDLFISGLKRHGITPEIRRADDARVSDLAVIWAHRHHELFKMQRSAGAHYLVMERGYIGNIEKRRQWTSLGFDGLNGRATFPPRDNGDRWHQYFGDVMQPWKSGDYAVVMGQVRGDASLNGFDIVRWYTEATVMIKRECKMPVIFRPHPRDDRTPVPMADRIDRSELSDCLAGAAVAVTYNSNSGVDAVLAGVPTVAFDLGSMAWDVSGRNIADRLKPNRTAWAYGLACTQWTDDEIKSGEAWPHLEACVA